jgi:hypothetical protein
MSPIFNEIHELWEEFKKELEEADEIIEDDEASTNFK